MSQSSLRRPAAARVARAVRSGDTAEEVEARRALAAISITEYVERVVASAPPLNDAQRARITSILAGAA